MRGSGLAPVHLSVAVGRMGAGRASAPCTGACARGGAQRALDLSEEHLRTQTKEHGPKDTPIFINQKKAPATLARDLGHDLKQRRLQVSDIVCQSVFGANSAICGGVSFPPLDQSRCLLRQGQARKPQPRRATG